MSLTSIFPVSVKHSEKDLQLRLAHMLVTRAVEALSDLGENEQRIAWLLEDCISLIESVPGDMERGL